ncbi:MAG: hypothetical protein ACR2QW_00280 [bacterium]
MSSDTETLLITNGDSAVSLMQAAGVEGHFLPWRDVLHDGPVPADLSLDQLSMVRARYIAEVGWGEPEDVERGFKDRDRVLKRCRDFQKVELWFEHDLYDQLQILQILDWIAGQQLDGLAVGLICTEQYLGRMTPDTIYTLKLFEQAVTETQLRLAETGWRAYRSDTPLPWFSLLQRDTSALPFLGDAVLRTLEEYPDYSTGLSKTEARVLGALRTQVSAPAQLFAHIQNLEPRVYLGDLSFWEILNGLLEGPKPLINWAVGSGKVTTHNIKQRLKITNTGKLVLEGSKNRLDIYWPARWFGGVRPNQEFTWCWNTSLQAPQKRHNILNA